MSWISEVWERENSWVGARSFASEKSMSSRLMKTLRVWGAEEEFEVRTRIEWSLTWPVKLLWVAVSLVQV
jgi:hypothetical protein